MRGTTMPTYTVSVTGTGALAPQFEAMLDVLPSAAMVGTEDDPVVTVFFDVKAPDDDAAIERAYLRVQGVLRGAEVTFTIVPSSTVEGRRPWWRQVFAR